MKICLYESERCSNSHKRINYVSTIPAQYRYNLKPYSFRGCSVFNSFLFTLYTYINQVPWNFVKVWIVKWYRMINSPLTQIWWIMLLLPIHNLHIYTQENSLDSVLKKMCRCTICKPLILSKDKRILQFHRIICFIVIKIKQQSFHCYDK